MNCQVYISFYSLKNKYINNSITKDNIYRDYCSFTPWKLYVEEFDPTSYSHMKWLDNHLKHCCYLNNHYMISSGFKECFFFDPDVIDWYPQITINHFQHIQYIPCLKVVYNNKPINFSQYLNQYYKNKDDKKNKHRQEFQKDVKNSMPYMLRRCRTTQELRNKLSPDEKKELKDMGIVIKERTKRNSHNLPNLYDDIVPNIYSYNWKLISKNKKQYNINQENSKKKQIRGEYYKTKRKRKF